MKVFTEELALLLTEKLLDNDKKIKEELEEKIDSIKGVNPDDYVTKDDVSDLVSKAVDETIEVVTVNDITNLFN